MRISLKRLRIVLFGILLIASPIFVLAKDCEVDKNSSGDEDGSKKHPYQTITKALEKGCDDIDIARGTYNEKIILGKGVELEGEGDKTIITKTIKMKDDSSLEGVYVKGEGIEVLKDASVDIKNTKITGAHIGIVTKGGGKLMVYNCKIINNGKGLYLQYGKDVDIRNSEIVNNSEEGIDIRANIDGIIKNNNIVGNKESGIEVIAGKSDLIISNNVIKNNKASGIAVQFYKENWALGNLKISSNILENNKNYGVDCKIPSGGLPSYKYWSRSVDFAYNKVNENGKGNFSKNCDFSKEDILKATKTESEIEALKKKLEKNTSEEEVERLRKEREEKERIAQQEKDWEIKRKIESKMDENFQTGLQRQENIIQKIKQEKKIKIFFLGIDSENIEHLKKELDLYGKTIEEIKKDLEKIQTEELKKDLIKTIEEKELQYKNNSTLYNHYNNKFGLFPWFKKIFS